MESDNESDDATEPMILESMRAQRKSYLLEEIMNPSQECHYPRTHLTPQSSIPKSVGTLAFQLLNKICKEISESSPLRENSKNVYNYNIALLFYFFQIFLTPSSAKKQTANINKKITSYLDEGKLPDLPENTHQVEAHEQSVLSSSLQEQKKKRTPTQTNQNDDPFHTSLPEEKLNKMIKICRSGRYRKAIKCLTQGETADPADKKTFDMFKSLHPQRECDYDRLTQLYNSIRTKKAAKSPKDRDGIMMDILTELVGKLKDDKAVGPTNWNNRAIKQCFKKCKYFPKALCTIAVNMETGNFPFPHLLTDSFLIGIWKNPEHTGIRPIAIANNLSKLLVTAAWKFCMRYRDIKELPIQKNQFGIEVSCGAELPAFITREYYRENALHQTISLDITNAFNSVDREAVLTKVKESLPQLAPLVGLLYLHDSRLTLSSGQIILSKQGVRQGCPLSPLLFSLAIDKILKEENKLAKEYGAQVVAYLDDHTFIQTKDSESKRSELTIDLIHQRIQPLLNDLKLELNESKCYIFKPRYEDKDNVVPKNSKKIEEEDEEEEERIEKKKRRKTASTTKTTKGNASKQPKGPPDIVDSEENTANTDQESHAIISNEGVVLLGIPIGTKKFISDFVEQSLKEKTDACKRLVELPIQIAYHMLRLVIAPTPVFLVRALGDDFELFKEWDKKIEREIFRLANQVHDYIKYKGADDDRIPKDELDGLIENAERRAECKQITIHSRENFQNAERLIYLSSREGGLGVMLTERMAMNAFLASTLNSLAMLESKKIIHTLSSMTEAIISNNSQNLRQPACLTLLKKIDGKQYKEIKQSETKGLQRTLTTVTQKRIKLEVTESFKKNSNKRLAPLFEDHQGDHANRILIKPPTLTKTYLVSDYIMQEVISQTLLLTNDLDITTCIAKPGSTDQHKCTDANHMNACSFTGGLGTRHNHAKVALQHILKKAEIPVTNEKPMAKEGTNFRADIYVSDPNQPAILDVTCVQTSQNHKKLQKAMEDAYRRKIDTYNSMRYKCKLYKEFKEGVKLIPVVIGPRGQFHTKSWQDLTRFLGIQSAKASKQEAVGVAPFIKNKKDPEMSAYLISLLKALAFRVAVDTAKSALKWQELQKERWDLNKKACGVTIVRHTNNNTD